MKSTITEQQLLDNGWVKNLEDTVFPISKKILTVEGDEDNDLKIELVFHRMDGPWLFGVWLPDGGLLNFNPATIEELNQFENFIIGYTPNY